MRFMRKLLCAFLLIIPGLFCFQTQGSAQSVDYSVHANIIYRFTKYINWPDDKKSGDFVIGVIGDTPLLNELKIATENKMVDNQRITVCKVTLTQLNHCNILFITEDESGELKKIISLTQ